MDITKYSKPMNCHVLKALTVLHEGVNKPLMLEKIVKQVELQINHAKNYNFSKSVKKSLTIFTDLGILSCRSEKEYTPRIKLGKLSEIRLQMEAGTSANDLAEITEDEAAPSALPIVKSEQCIKWRNGPSGTDLNCEKHVDIKQEQASNLDENSI